MHRAAAQPFTPGLLVWMAPVANIVWLAVIGFSMWYGYHHVPAVRDAMDVAITTLRETAEHLRDR
jgi:hypothetical protein